MNTIAITAAYLHRLLFKHVPTDYTVDAAQHKHKQLVQSIIPQCYTILCVRKKFTFANFKHFEVLHVLLCLALLPVTTKCVVTITVKNKVHTYYYYTPGSRGVVLCKYNQISQHAGNAYTNSDYTIVIAVVHWPNCIISVLEIKVLMSSSWLPLLECSFWLSLEVQLSRRLRDSMAWV